MTERPWRPQSPTDVRNEDPADRPGTPVLSRFAHRPSHEPPARLPAPAPEEKRKPFWRRIGLTRPAAEDPPATALEPILARLAALESEFQARHANSEGRLARSERILRRLEERDRQVSLLKIRQRLDGLEIDQAEMEESLQAAQRSLRGLAALALLALLSAAGTLFLFFYLYAGS